MGLCRKFLLIYTPKNLNKYMQKRMLIRQIPAAIIALMLIAASQPLRAQSAEKDNIHFDKNQYRFTQVVEVPEKNQAALYKLAEYWAADNARTPREKIQVQDKSSGRIILIGSINVPRSGLFVPNDQESDYVLFTATLDTKDGKTRIIMDHFVHYGGISEGTANSSGGSLTRDRPSGSWFGKGRWNRTKTFVYDMSQKYLRSFKAAMEGRGRYVPGNDF